MGYCKDLPQMGSDGKASLHFGASLSLCPFAAALMPGRSHEQKKLFVTHLSYDSVLPHLAAACHVMLSMITIVTAL